MVWVSPFWHIRELLFSQAEQKDQRRGGQLAVATLCSTAAQLVVPLYCVPLCLTQQCQQWPVL